MRDHECIVLVDRILIFCFILEYMLFQFYMYILVLWSNILYHIFITFCIDVRNKWQKKVTERKIFDSQTQGTICLNIGGRTMRTQDSGVEYILSAVGM